MTHDEAVRIAEDYVKQFGDDMTVVRERTIEFKHGWVFFWENRSYIETGNSLYKAMGNVPFVVDRNTKQVTHIGPGSLDIPADYEASLKGKGPARKS